MGRIMQPTESAKRRQRPVTATEMRMSASNHSTSRTAAVASTEPATIRMFEPVKYDPRLVMEIRHAAVKDKREERRRRKELEERVRQTRIQLSHFQQQHLQLTQSQEYQHNAESEKASAAKLLEEEVNRMKKQLEEEIEDLKRCQQEKIDTERAIQQESQIREKLHTVRTDQQRAKQEAKKRNRDLLKAKASTWVLTRQLKLLQRYYTIWRKRYLDAHAAIQHAIKIVKWRCMSRQFHRWLHHFKVRRASREQKRIAELLKKERSDEQCADKHRQRKISRKVLIWWATWHRITVERKRAQLEHSTNQTRIATFLGTLKRVRSSHAGAEQSPPFPTVLTSDAKPPLPTPAETVSVSSSSPIIIQHEESPTLHPEVAPSNDASPSPSPPQTGPLVVNLVAPLPKPPELMAMEERERMRKERRERLNQIYKEKELEKDRKRQEDEEKRLAEVEAQRQAALEKKKEERREARKRELERQRRLQREQEMDEFADNQHRLSIMKIYGWKPWRDLIHRKTEQFVRAEHCHHQRVRRQTLSQWKDFVQKRRRERAVKSTVRVVNIRRLLVRHLKRVCLDRWKEFVVEIRDSEIRAGRHHTCRVLRRCFDRWYPLFTKRSQRRELHELDQEKQAIELSHRFVLQSHLGMWRAAFRICRREREIEHIKKSLRDKANSYVQEFRDRRGQTHAAQSPMLVSQLAMK